MQYRFLSVLLVILTVAFIGPTAATAADWPQFMRDAGHTGDAADETLRLPLGLAAHVKLEDAVLTSPAVVKGRAYVVDQMGTAYCIDPKKGKIIWRAAPDGDKAMGSNTSSPCVVNGRVYFGTTGGTFHILDAASGQVIKTLRIGSPIVSAPTFANNAIYFQAIDAVLRCHDLDGNERWRWDHYARYQEPPDLTKAKEANAGIPVATIGPITAAAMSRCRASGSSPASAGTSSAWKKTGPRPSSSGAIAPPMAATGRRRCPRPSPVTGSTTRAWAPTDTSH